MNMFARNYEAPNPCKHLADYKLNHGLEGYTRLENWLETTSTGRIMIKNPRSHIPRCDFCSGQQGRLYLCLVCWKISCCLSTSSSSSSSEFKHAHLHSESLIGHEIAVDMDRAELYCCACNDQVYDPDFDKAVISKQLEVMPGKNGENVIGVVNREEKMTNGVVGKRRSSRRGLRSWVELDLVSPKRPVLRGDRRTKTVYPLGLRGLNNLGNTCYMNSVLQALLHAPPLRNYFLTDRHNREFCRKRSGDQLCFACDIDGMFSAVFSGDRMPYTPAQFLRGWWLQFENLASYEQQDAHEFFISMLDQIHEKEVKESKATIDSRDCDCIAHKVFSGLLQSDVTCTTCGATSTTYDPCVDISLDLKNVNLCPTSVLDSLGKSTRSNESTSMSTLLSSLDLFTKPERLGSDQKLYCEHCQEKRDSLKQMSIKRLPLVLCLHIKRFEHSTIKKLSRKVDQYLQFPFSLHMSPYLSSTIVSSRYGNRMFGFDNDNEAGPATEYEIFAVVTHSGTLESGHYSTYLRLSDQWYKCDDAWILAVDEETVRASQCYMIYYVQKMFYHNKTTEDSSCSPLSQRNDAFFPIVGCC